MERPTQLRPASVAAYVRPLRAFSRWCAREFGIAEPLASLRGPRVELEPLVLSWPEQLCALLACHRGNQRPVAFAAAIDA